MSETILDLNSTIAAIDSEFELFDNAIEGFTAAANGHIEAQKAEAARLAAFDESARVYAREFTGELVRKIQRVDRVLDNLKGTNAPEEIVAEGRSLFQTLNDALILAQKDPLYLRAVEMNTRPKPAQRQAPKTEVKKVDPVKKESQWLAPVGASVTVTMDGGKTVVVHENQITVAKAAFAKGVTASNIVGVQPIYGRAIALGMKNGLIE